MMVLRHSVSVLLLPVVVVVLVPIWLTRTGAAAASLWPESEAIEWMARIVGAAIFLVAFALFTWCVALFARVGRGTLAPWDPTQRLVSAGPYRYVRNPMITAVAGMLAAEAILFDSLILAAWAIVFVLINHVYFVHSEEPGLVRRFGEPYVGYKQAVPRWFPRGTRKTR